MTTPFPGSPPTGVNYGTFAFTVKQTILASLAASVAHALPAREQVPALGCFRVAVVTSPGVLQLAATNGEQVITAFTVAVAAEKGGVACIPARKLLAILREAPPGGEVTVSVVKNEAVISVGSSVWTLKLPDGSAYPELPKLSGIVFTPYSRQKLITAIRGVRHAVCKDAAQPTLTQVSISSGGSAVATASDRTRLARAAVAGFPVAATIPAPVLDDMVRVLSEHPDDNISVGDAPGYLAIAAGHVTLAIAKRSTQFPDMDKQLLEPAVKANTSRLTVDKAELDKAVRRVAITADAQTSAIALRLSGKQVTVEARDKGGNSSSEVIPAAWDDKPRVVVVNHSFLSEMLAASASPSCVFLLGPDAGKKLSPLLLSGKDGEVQVLTRMPAALLGY